MACCDTNPVRLKDVCRDSIHVEGGEICLSYPVGMSPAEWQVFESWLALELRMIKARNRALTPEVSTSTSTV